LFAVPYIEVDDRTYRELELLAVAWNTTIADALTRLVVTVATAATARRARPALPPVALQAVYAGTRVDATFDPESHAVTVCSGPLCGQRYTSPSGARRAVVALLNPTVSPVGNGWNFWTVTDTGDRLHTLRRR
jgi:hypothetical protein